MTERERFESGKDQARALWQAGDYEGFVQTFRSSAADDLAATFEMSGGKALDVACGTGASSFPLARRGFEVTGIDLSPHLLAVARRDADRQGLAITFDEGFMEEMPYPTASFDAAVSMFGIMFSPAPRMAADEIARVLKPGARLALTNWTRGGFSGRMSGVLAPYLPPTPADAPSPFDWGDADKVSKWLDARFEIVDAEIVSLVWSVEMPPASAARRFIDTAGVIKSLMGLMAEEQRNDFTAEFERLWEDHDRAGRADRTEVRNEYLRIIARRRQVV